MIPKIKEPSGKYWTQPDPSNFIFVGEGVSMSDNDFRELLEYSRTTPTGVYEGKMWKAESYGRILRPWPIRLIPRWRYGLKRKWYLRWYENHGANSCIIRQREIVIRKR